MRRLIARRLADKETDDTTRQRNSSHKPAGVKRISEWTNTQADPCFDATIHSKYYNTMSRKPTYLVREEVFYCTYGSYLQVGIAR